MSDCSAFTRFMQHSPRVRLYVFPFSKGTGTHDEATDALRCRQAAAVLAVERGSCTVADLKKRTRALKMSLHGRKAELLDP